MNNFFTEQMNTAWKEWHGNMSEEDIPITPNPSFEKGFAVAINAVMPLLKGSLVAVQAFEEMAEEARRFNKNIQIDSIKSLSKDLKAVTS